MLLSHVGCAIETSHVEALKVKAQQRLKTLQHKHQQPLFPEPAQAKATLTNWRIIGYHHVFGSVYDTIGFPGNLLRDLVVGRIVYPKSKLATLRYFKQHLGIALSKDRTYRFMDTLSKSTLTRIAYEFVKRKHPQGVTLCFYDVTTLSFTTDTQDAIRSKGYSKDHRHDMPQVLIGLFVDHRGYPFDYDIFSGKTFEGHTFSKAINRLIKKYQFKNLTVVADAGMLSWDNIEYLIDKNLRYIVGARIRNLSNKETAIIIANDYVKKPTITIPTTKGRLIVEHSSVRDRKDKHARNKRIAKIQEKIDTKSTVIRKSKYIKLSGKSKVIGIDKEKIKKDELFDGLKGYVTNRENTFSSREIITHYHALWNVEKAFRMSKHDLAERPIYHQKEERIKAHLLICFVSLLVMKESETILSTINCSTNRAIELLANVGAGLVKVGTVELKTESEVTQETKEILELFEGH